MNTFRIKGLDCMFAWIICKYVNLISVIIEFLKGFSCQEEKWDESFKIGFRLVEIYV